MVQIAHASILVRSGQKGAPTVKNLEGLIEKAKLPFSDEQWDLFVKYSEEVKKIEGKYPDTKDKEQTAKRIKEIDDTFDKFIGKISSDVLLVRITFFPFLFIFLFSIYLLIYRALHFNSPDWRLITLFFILFYFLYFILFLFIHRAFSIKLCNNTQCFLFIFILFIIWRKKDLR